jgi:hypothetical protein
MAMEWRSPAALPTVWDLGIEAEGAEEDVGGWREGGASAVEALGCCGFEAVGDCLSLSR